MRRRRRSNPSAAWWALGALAAYIGFQWWKESKRRRALAAKQEAPAEKPAPEQALPDVDSPAGQAAAAGDAGMAKILKMTVHPTTQGRSRSS